MSTQEEKERLLVKGTLDLLILRTLIFGPRHGQGIARAIQQTSQDELLVEHGAIYPALQRLVSRGWISAEMGRIQEQPQSPSLQTDEEWPHSTRQGNGEMETPDCGYWPRS